MIPARVSEETLDETTRRVMNEINACSPGQPLAVVPTLFAFGPISRALAEREAALQSQLTALAADAARLQAELETLKAAVRGYVLEFDDPWTPWGYKAFAEKLRALLQEPPA